MICGASGHGSDYEWEDFPYRSSSYLTQFFENCDLPYAHDGSTRKWWVQTVLDKLNRGPTTNRFLPPDTLVRVVQELMDPLELEQENLDRESALKGLNKALGRDGLQAYFDGAGRCHVRNLEGSESSVGGGPLRRALTPEEVAISRRLEEFMDGASEDTFTSDMLVPLFRQLGFIRVVTAGHKDKALEFGKDVWMKYQLPTDHYIYFGVQVKLGKLDSSSGSLNRNIATILDQVSMSLRDPIFDAETGRRNLVDHVLIVTAGEITKAAKRLVAENLDASQRRHVLFMDRDHLLDLWLRLQLPVPGEMADVEHVEEDGLPF